MIIVYVVDKEYCNFLVSNCFIRWQKIYHLNQSIGYYKDCIKGLGRYKVYNEIHKLEDHDFTEISSGHKYSYKQWQKILEREYVSHVMM